MKKILLVLGRAAVVIILVGLFFVFGRDGIVVGLWSDHSNQDYIDVPSKSDSFSATLIEDQIGGYPIDVIFEEFYLAFGGEEILGSVISPSFTSGFKIYQYVENGLMEFDGSRVANDRFSFAPLGIILVEEGLIPLSTTDLHNRSEIHQDFLLFYRRLGGARYVGNPLGGARFNLEKGRLEQYFENLGFYKTMDSEVVHLLPNGRTSCGELCRKGNFAANIPRLSIDLPEPYLRMAARIGRELTGRTLSSPYVALDGLEEVIFENLVLARDLQNPEYVFVRPVAESIGFWKQALTRRLDHPLIIFFPVEKNLGYNVPVYFLDYIETHGGLQISGMPIEEVFSPQPGEFRQCFSNLCLQFNLNEVGDDQLKPLPLGVKYKALMQASVFDFKSSSSLDTVTIKAWELNPALSPEDRQVISVGIFQHGYPLVDREPVLFLKLPGNGLKVIYLPPTDQNGITEITLEPIQAPVGTLISYDVCLFNLPGYRKCEGDNYLIWNYD